MSSEKYMAFVPLLKQSELAAYRFELAGKTLLEHARDVASKASCVESVVVQTRDGEAASYASSLGMSVQNPSDGMSREPHFMVSLHYPFRHPDHFEQLVKADAATVACLTPHRHHPVGAFVAKKGRMDFSQTLDAPDWQGIDERQYFQPIESLSLHYAPAKRKRAYLILDEISALGVFSERDLKLAKLVHQRGLATQPNGATTWKSL